MSRRARLDKVIEKARELERQGLLSRRDIADWLRDRGVKVSARSSWDRIAEAVRSARIKVSEFQELIERYARSEEEVERTIIIKEKAKRRKEEVTRAARSKRTVKASVKARTTVRGTEVMKLIWKLYPGDPETALEAVKYILDELGVRYKDTDDVAELVESLSQRAMQRVVDELRRRLDWKRFQDQVQKWASHNLKIVKVILESGGSLKQEQYMRGATGIQYRFDILGTYHKRGILSRTFYLFLAEVKNYKDPVPLEDVMVFKEKVRDVLISDELPWPDRVVAAMFSASGYTERAMEYARKVPAIYDPERVYIELYTKEGNTFKRVAP